LPVVEALGAEAVLSVDTASAEVAAAALAAGARIVNDVTALGDPAMAGVVAGWGAGVVLMHMKGTPATMQSEARYHDVVDEVAQALAARLEAARRSGIAAEAVILDPGIGFAKTAAHNHELLAGLDRLGAAGRPLMVGVSRKSFLGTLLDLPVDERLEGGLAAAAIAVFLGARVVRTHDVLATRRAVRVAEALRSAGRPRSASGA
jgi:dihydropteroate synthase